MNLSHLMLFFFGSAYGKALEAEGKLHLRIDETASLASNVKPEELDMLLREENYEEFAKKLEIELVELVKPDNGVNKRDYERTTGSFFGDILLTSSQTEMGRQGMLFEELPDSRWPGRIPYAISDKYKPETLQLVKNGIAKWNSQVHSIKWLPRQASDDDYIYIFPGDGCYSLLGKKGGAQPLSLQEDICFTKPGYMLHEMVHGVGFSHEHNRPDRDQYVEILWGNIGDDWKDQYELTDPREIGTQTRYDYGSIMHYKLTAPFSVKHAFRILTEGVEGGSLGQREKFSDLDIQKIDRLYS